MTDDKTRETRLRHVAQRHGYRLTKSERRDPNAVDYRLYGVIDVSTNCLVNPASLIGTSYS